MAMDNVIGHQTQSAYGSDDVFRQDEVEDTNVSGDQTLDTTDRFGFTGGDQYTDPDSETRVPIAILLAREKKWLKILENWDEWMTKDYTKIRDKCRQGIPGSLRARVWQYLCGASTLIKKHPHRYQALLKKQADPCNVESIKKDLHRSFPTHEMFTTYGGDGQQNLNNVLRAYTVYNPKDGFCQAHVPIASVLLMHMPEEQAFWCLVSILENYIPGYHSDGLNEVLQDGKLLLLMLKREFPKLHKRMLKLGIDPPLFMLEWFLCIYARDLPWSTVLRVWDMFLCEGVKVLFRVALVLLKHCLDDCDTMPEEFYDLLSRLKTKNMPAKVLQESFLVEECIRLKITDKDFVKTHKKLCKLKAIDNGLYNTI